MDALHVFEAEPFRPTGVGWSAFGDVSLIVEMGTVLAMATVLAALLAYHPATRHKAQSLEQVEQPKILILYAMVGSVIAQIVRVQPSMALVIFGIGGLLRFRTDVGEAKDTGRVILVTVVGLCCGLELYVIATLATLSGFALIALLESTRVMRLRIQGIEPGSLVAVSKAHGEALRAAGCTIVGEDKNAKKGTVALVFRAPRRFDRAQVEAMFDALPAEVRGAVDWDLA